MLYTLILSFFLSIGIYGEPPSQIPEDMRSAFTCGGTIPVSYWYLNNASQVPRKVLPEILEIFSKKAKSREWSYHGELDGYVFQALDSLKDLKGKQVCLMGAQIAWYEGVLLSYGAHPFVIGNRPIQTADTRVKYVTRDQFVENPRTFDFVMSVSNTDSRGLGSYGEPLNPNGDFEEMKFFKKILNPGGKLLLSIPIGPDALVWNSHRIYGWKRLKQLLKGWKPIRYYGFKRANLDNEPGYHYQPVLLLTPR